MKSLADLAVDALPGHLRRVYHKTGKSAEMVAREAETFVRLRGLTGRVGPRPHDMAGHTLGGGMLRINCHNNPEFWLVCNADTCTAQGRLPAELYRPGETAAPGKFVVRRLGRDRLRIDHTACSAFWVQLTF